jgi:hypothetical protein
MGGSFFNVHGPWEVVKTKIAEFSFVLSVSGEVATDEKMPEFSFVFGVYKEGRENEKCQSLVLFRAFLGGIAKTKNSRV